VSRGGRRAPVSEDRHEGQSVSQADVREVQDHPPARYRAGDLLEPAASPEAGV